MDALQILAEGDIEVEGRMPYSSNATFLVHVRQGDTHIRAIYKPLRGERPLWDFPPGLYRREVAAYRLSVAMGLHLVPPTIEREGPYGIGSLQLFIDADFAEHYFTLFEKRPELHDQFRAMAAFDVIANNTDRKSGHCLIDANDHVWGIDNGLCFAADFKLRTVIWEFGGEMLSDDLRARVQAVVDSPPLDVTTLLFDDEAEALVERASLLAQGGAFPIDASGHRYPWPMV
ncbi:MAG: phosphatidylinositol kinase [Acidimicrobiales bacterium mtb01]|nr:SCO1664 family protein [Actinomycetota bacterium]TEX46534.1 MAG: phosphatidylinositol kinase [Acidimicrobiales bacterium mtb01]